MRANPLAPAGLALLFAAAGCDEQPPPQPPAREEAAQASPTPESKSIIRPAVAEEEKPFAPPLAAKLDATVLFGDRDMTLSEAARAKLDELLQSETVRGGGPVVLRGHSDSRGFDGDNLVSSRRRAEAVRTYLEERGIAPARITVIALGEARPVAPNAKLDGSDDPEGRAKNRRVEIEIRLPEPKREATPAAAPTPTG